MRISLFGPHPCIIFSARAIFRLVSNIRTAYHKMPFAVMLMATVIKCCLRLTYLVVHNWHRILLLEPHPSFISMAKAINWNLEATGIILPITYVYEVQLTSLVIYRLGGTQCGAQGCL